MTKRKTGAAPAAAKAAGTTHDRLSKGREAADQWIGQSSEERGALSLAVETLVLGWPQDVTAILSIERVEFRIWGPGQIETRTFHDDFVGVCPPDALLRMASVLIGLGRAVACHAAVEELSF